jgi:hypothetical protein
LGLDNGTNRELSDGGKGKAEAAPSPPYTDEEKGWLKREWGGEFKFLAAYGLSIYKDEDREPVLRPISGAPSQARMRPTRFFS